MMCITFMRRFTIAMLKTSYQLLGYQDMPSQE
jgi:hypothetical protein